MTDLWQRVLRDLEPDGALRDIVVRGTTIADWQRLLDFGGCNVTVEPQTLPVDEF